MKLPQLVELLTGAGLDPLVFKHHNGGAYVVLPYGARVIGMYPTPDAENVFWVDPQLQTAADLRQALTREAVLGGDRLWLAPERGLFFKGSKEADGVAMPTSLDPGRWLVTKATKHAVKLLDHVDTPYHLAPGTRVRATLERSIRMCHSPFSDALTALPVLARVKFVGYEIATRLELLAAPTDTFYVGLWFLIQMCTAGYAYVPTWGRPVVTDYYEPTGPDYLRVSDDHVRFRLDSLTRHKIGVRKVEVTGRAAYLRDDVGGQSVLVIRNFFNNPSGHYADVPLHTPAGTQDSVQFYNHKTGGLAGFGELEFHGPGLKLGMSEPVLYDTNQVWVFSGARADLVQVAARLLGLGVKVFDL